MGDQFPKLFRKRLLGQPHCFFKASGDTAGFVFVELRGELLLDLLARRPDLARRLLAALAGRITDLADRLESQNSDNAVTRVAKWMVDLPRISGHGSSIMIPGTKKAAAAALMMTPETFSRSLRALQDAGIVRVDGRRVYILEVARLLGAAGA